MKKIEVQMLLYTLTKNFMEDQKYMLNPFGVILFYKVVGWFDGRNIVWNQVDQGSIPFTNIYYVEYVYLYIYFVHVCKCIIHRWVVDR
jgi:hypothetical protein